MASPALTLTDDDISRMAPATLTDADISAHESGKPAEQPGFIASLAGKANPMNVVRGAASAIAHPLDTLKNWRDESQSLHDAAVDAAQRGDYREALDHGLGFIANLIPGLGKPADDFLTSARSGSDDEFKSKAGEFLGQALATAEGEGVAKAVGKVPDAAGAVAKEVQKPGTLQAAGGAAQVVAGLGALAHEPMAGVYALGRGVRDISVGMDKRTKAAAAAAVPPIWDDIAQGTAGKKYLDLNLEEQAKVQDLAAKMGAKPATPSPPSNPPSQPTATASAPISTTEPSMAPSVPAMPQPIRLVPRTQPMAPIEPSAAPVLPGAPRPVTPPPVEIPKRPVSEAPTSTAAPTSDPNVIWDPDRGHIDTRTGKPPVKEPDVVVIPREQAQQIVDRLADTDKLYGKYSAKPNSAAQIQRNADALKKAAEKKPKTVSDLMSVNLENLG